MLNITFRQEQELMNTGILLNHILDLDPSCLIWGEASQEILKIGIKKITKQKQFK